MQGKSTSSKDCTQGEPTLHYGWANVLDRVRYIQVCGSLSVCNKTYPTWYVGWTHTWSRRLHGICGEYFPGPCGGHSPCTCGGHFLGICCCRHKWLKTGLSFHLFQVHHYTTCIPPTCQSHYSTICLKFDSFYITYRLEQQLLQGCMLWHSSTGI